MRSLTETHVSAPCDLGASPSLSWSTSRCILERLIIEESHNQDQHMDEAYLGQVKTKRKRKPSPKQKLIERLNRLSLDMIQMLGDGNCQFRSLSNELFGSQDHHLEVRAQVVQHVRDHSEEFTPFLDEDFEPYVRVSEATYLLMNSRCPLITIVTLLVLNPFTDGVGTPIGLSRPDPGWCDSVYISSCRPCQSPEPGETS
jgi:hypothetical protein